MNVRGAAMLAVGLIAATPAWAGDKQDFEACDGRMHPGKQDDGMRGMASTPRWSFPGATQPDTVAICTRALASPRLLPTQTLRRAHLLRARAAAHLRAGETKEALADVDAAEAAAGPLASDRFYHRSMGLSLSLLRAIALAQSGDVAQSTTLARSAMSARPYSLQVQQIGAVVLQAGRGVGDASASPWLTVARLAPDAASTALLREGEVGNYAAVVALRNTVEPEWPTQKLAPLAFLIRDPAANQLTSAMLVGLQSAYARAATGDPAGARRELAAVRSHLDLLRPDPAPDKLAVVGGSPYEQLGKYVDLRARQIEARIAVAEKRPADALTTLVAAPMPHDAASAELLVALKAALPSDKASLVPDPTQFRADAAKERITALGEIIPEALIAPETPRSLVDYSRARPNILGALIGGALSMGTSLLGGISRTDGFRSTANPDGTTKVEFIGNTPSATLVQEMTLLRAAEVTRAAGKPAFVIVKRADYSRRYVTSQYGREISSVPTGFKTELTIRYPNAGEEPARALDAVAIIDALGPLYYEEKKS